MASTHKKVIVRKLDRDSVQGYLPPANFISDSKLEILNTAGTAIRIQLSEVKGVFFVREFGDSETLQRKTFTSRPRTEGLWVRLRFRDGEMLEGLMPNDLTQVTADGFFLNPPDTRSNTQRIFVPRSAVAELTVLAVIGSQARRRRPWKITSKCRCSASLAAAAPVEPVRNPPQDSAPEAADPFGHHDHSWNRVAMPVKL